MYPVKAKVISILSNLMTLEFARRQVAVFGLRKNIGNPVLTESMKENEGTVKLM